MHTQLFTGDGLRAFFSEEFQDVHPHRWITPEVFTSSLTGTNRSAIGSGVIAVPWRAGKNIYYAIDVQYGNTGGLFVGLADSCRRGIFPS